VNSGHFDKANRKNLTLFPNHFFFPGGLPLPFVTRLCKLSLLQKPHAPEPSPYHSKGGNQADVREAEFGFAAQRGDLKDNLGAVPLSLVFDKVEFGIRYMPYDFLARHQFRDLLGAGGEGPCLCSGARHEPAPKSNRSFELRLP
jgi:hypothetical protein